MQNNNVGHFTPELSTMPEEEEEEDQSNGRDTETNNEDQNATRTTLELLSDEFLNPQVQ